MTFTPERVDWCGIIIPNLLLLGVVSHTHSDVVITRATVHITVKEWNANSVGRTTRY